MKKKLIVMTVCAVLFAGCDAELNTQAEVDIDSSISGVQWQLVELMGMPVEVDEGKKEPFIFLESESNKFNGFSGCNNFFGTYELNEEQLRISFSKVGATLMACEDMDTQRKMFQVIEMADNYSIAENQLSLNKARMAPLARFRKTD